MKKCATCGRLNHDTEQICVYCGAPLIDLAKQNATRAVGDTDYEEGVPKWGSARFNFNMTLVIHVVETRKSLCVGCRKCRRCRRNCAFGRNRP